MDKRNSCKEMKDVIDHFQNGGNVEQRLRDDNTRYIFQYISNPVWNFDQCEYRPQVVPMEFSLKICNRTSLLCNDSCSNLPEESCNNSKNVKFREVIE